MKKGIKDALAPQGLFEDLGLKYVGPVDGHDRAAMEQALAQAKRFGGPVIVHALTRKGFGYDAAERHEADQFHSPGPFDVETGEEDPKGRIWTDVFADEIVRIGQRRSDVVAITAAMMHPVGLHHFQARFPERTFDVGIAEQHAATSRRRPGDGRPAPGGRRLRDVPQPGLRPGADGRRPAPLRRHVRARPGRRDRRRRRQPQRHVGHVDPPGRARPAARRARATAPGCASCSARRSRSTTPRPCVRFPKGPPPDDIPAGRQGRRAPTCWSATAPRTCWSSAVGSMAARRRRRGRAGSVAQGIGVTVVDPRWVKPVDPALVELAREHRLVVSIEDNGRVGGCGAAAAADAQRRRRRHAVPPARHPAGVPRPRQAGGDPRADRPHPAGPRAGGIVEDMTALAEGDAPGRCRPAAVGRSARRARRPCCRRCCWPCCWYC